jgi:hypothetical protein
MNNVMPHFIECAEKCMCDNMCNVYSILHMAFLAESLKVGVPVLPTF